MKINKYIFIIFISAIPVLSISCGASGKAHHSDTNTNKATLGTIISATVGGNTGYAVGKIMDMQAQDIRMIEPSAKVNRVEEGIVAEFQSLQMFAANQFVLIDSSKKILNNLMIILKKYPETNIEIQGHTNNIGSQSDNMMLSVKRATSISDYLKANGIAASRLSAKGFGEANPEYNNKTSEGLSQNERIEILITANRQMKTEAAQQQEK